MSIAEFELSLVSNFHVAGSVHVHVGLDLEGSLVQHFRPFLLETECHLHITYLRDRNKLRAICLLVFSSKLGKTLSARVLKLSGKSAL